MSSQCFVRHENRARRSAIIITLYAAETGPIPLGGQRSTLPL